MDNQLFQWSGLLIISTDFLKKLEKGSVNCFYLEVSQLIDNLLKIKQIIVFA